MVLNFYFKRKDLNFMVWSLIYVIIGIYAYHSRTDITKDESKYLFYVEEGIADISLILAESIHFMHPLVLSYWFEFFGQTPIYFLNLTIFLLSCRYFLRSTDLNNELFLISLLPTAFYAGTYLRELFLFSLIFILVGLLLRNRILLALFPSMILTGYRFYWAIIGFFSIMIWGGRKFGFVLMFLYLIIFMYIFSEFAAYSINAMRKINIDPVDILRVFAIPLPTLRFEGDVNLYENAILYSITFPLKVFALFLFFITCIKAIFSPLKLSRDQKLILTIALLLLSSAFLTSLVGPRQVVLGQALLILSLTGKYKLRWQG